MSGFKNNLKTKADEASWLWVNSTTRAICFLIAFFISIGLLIAAEISEPWKILKTYRIDENNASSFQMATHKLAKSRLAKNDAVLLVGGSSTNELTANDAFVAADISKTCGRKIDFVKAGTPGQTLTEMWASTDALRDVPIEAVVIGFNTYKLEFSAIQNWNQVNNLRLPLRASNELKQAAKGSLAQSNPHFPSPRALGWLIGNRNVFTSDDASVTPTVDPDPLRFYSGRYQAPSRSLEQKKRIANRYFVESVVKIQRNFEPSTKLIEAFIEKLLAKDIKVVILVLPQSSAMDDANRFVENYMERALIRFQNLGAGIVDWRGHEALVEEDFYDQTHLLGSGREKLHPSVVQLAASLLDDCEEGR